MYKKPNVKIETQIQKNPAAIDGGQRYQRSQPKHKHMSKRKIGALWSKKTKEGQEYFTGVISDLRGDIQIVVFRNEKKSENQPDYDILLSEVKAKEDEEIVSSIPQS